MKNKFVMLAAIGLMTTAAVFGQEYKVAKSSGRLEIREVNRVNIEPATGNEIIFSSRAKSRQADDRSKGLRAISSMGIEDNTGIGLSVVEKGDVVEVQQLKKMDGPHITIKVPKGVKVVYTHTNPHGSDIEIRNFEGELDISTVHNGVELVNTTGPMEIKTVHGDIEASFNSNLKSAVSLVSVHGHVDLSLPATTKANLKMGTSWGEILVDPEIKIEIDRTGNMVKYSDRVSGKINGGGIDIELGSTHDNVYLRKSL